MKNNKTYKTKLYLLILIISISACTGRNSNNYNAKFGEFNKDSILSLQTGIEYSQIPLHEITIPAHSKLSQESNQYLKNLSKVVDTLIVVPLENNSSKGMLSIVDKIVVKDSILYVLDRDKAKKLYVFNRNTGKFIRTIGDVGRAENEYIQPHDFFIINDNLIGIYDHFGRKVLYFDINGVYLRTIRIKHIAMNMVNNDGDTTLWCVGHGNYHFAEINKFDLIKMGLSGKIYNGISHGKHYLNFSSPNNLNPYKNGVVYHHPYTNTLLHVKDTTCYKFAEVKFEEKGLPDDFIERCNGDMENFFKLFERTHSYIRDFILTDDYIYIKYIGEPRLPYILVYNMKENRIIAQGINGIEFGANVKPSLKLALLGSVNNSTSIYGNGDMVYGLINPISIQTIEDEEGFKRYNIDKKGLLDNNYFLVMVKLK